MAERLPGPKIPFYAPFPASKNSVLDANASPADRTFARVLCKDCIGLWLGWVPAPYRLSRFNDTEAPGLAGNDGRVFAINEKVSANPFKFSLMPGTQISGAKVNFSLGTVGQSKPYTVKSISVWMPGHVTVAQVLLWINGKLKGKINDAGLITELPDLEGGQADSVTNANLDRVLAVTTPNERKYNVRTIMVPKARPIIFPAQAAGGGV